MFNPTVFMQRHWLSPQQCGSILQSLTNSKSFKKGQKIHAYILSSGVHLMDTYLNTKLAAFYANCGHMNEANTIFDQIDDKKSFLWNSMIRGYATNHLSMQALLIYRKMARVGGGLLDKFTYPFVVKSCGDLGDVVVGGIVHCQVVVNGFEFDVYVGNCLLEMYVKFRDMGNARNVFDRMPVRDLTSWNSMIFGYVKNGDPEEGFRVFKEMMVAGEGVPDSTTLVGVLRACSEENGFEIGKQVHGYLLKNRTYSRDNFVISSLIKVYCMCRHMIYARRLFEEVLQKDSFSWNMVILGYAQNDEGYEGLRLFYQMLTTGGQPNLATFTVVLGICEKLADLDFGMSVHSYLIRKGFGTSIAAAALIGLYSRFQDLTCSRLVFDEIKEKNLASWTAMIATYAHHGYGKEALSTFQQMRANDIVPDEGTFTTILTGCSHAGLLKECREIFNQIQRECNMKPVVAHYACLVDLLGKAGQLKEAYKILRSMVVKPTDDMWASFLSSCRVYKNDTLAEIVGKEMLERKLGGFISLSMQMSKGELMSK